MNCEGNMSIKDTSIMLFGKKIPVPEYDIPVSSQMGCEIQANSTTMNAGSNSKHKGIEMPHTENIEKSKNSSNKENESKVNTSNVEETIENSSTEQDKVLKKPDKILQCPRCNNFDTKFCYFNNYNVNQPRHFCRNCHRYWTAGGSMRNVPVGAGRRKNKQITSQYRNMNVATNGIPAANLETNYITRYQHVLKFGQEDASLHESNDTMINRINQKRNVDESANNCRENGDEESSLCLSSVTNGYTQGHELSESEHNRSKPLKCHPTSSWMIPLNQSWNNASSKVQSSMQMCNPYGMDPRAMQWCHAPMVAVTNIFKPNIPLQFVHGSYWNGTHSVGSNGCISPSSSTTSNI